MPDDRWPQRSENMIPAQDAEKVRTRPWSVLDPIEVYLDGELLSVLSMGCPNAGPDSGTLIVCCTRIDGGIADA